MYGKMINTGLIYNSIKYIILTWIENIKDVVNKNWFDAYKVKITTIVDESPNKMQILYAPKYNC